MNTSLDVYAELTKGDNREMKFPNNPTYLEGTTSQEDKEIVKIVPQTIENWQIDKSQQGK